MITLTQLLIICPFMFIAGYVDAIAGGGGLITIPAYLLAGVPIHQAIATNNLGSGLGMSATVWRFAILGYFKGTLCTIAVIFGLIGTVCGAYLSLLTPDRLLLYILLFILPFVGIYVFKNKDLTKNDDHPLPKRKTYILLGITSLVIGAYNGFYGPGSGTFLLLLFTGLVHLPLMQAAGAAKIANYSMNIGAIIVFLINGKVLILLGLIAGVFSFLGNYFGSKYFAQKGSKAARPIILVVVCLFMVKLVHDLFFV